MRLNSLHARAAPDGHPASSPRANDGAARHRQIYERGSHVSAARAALAYGSPQAEARSTARWRKAARHAKPGRLVRVTVRRIGTLGAAGSSPITSSREWAAGLRGP